MAQQQSQDGAQVLSGIDDITAEQQSTATGPLAELFVHENVISSTHDIAVDIAVNETNTTIDPGKPVSALSPR